MRTQAVRRGDSPNLPLLTKKYVQADDRRAWRQVAGAVAAFVGLWSLAYGCLELSSGLALAASSLAGVALLRLFVLQHDLGHGALFRSKRRNDRVGSLFGVLTLVPFHYWRRLHNDHHGHAGNLDRRGPGCVTVLTVEEYLRLGWCRRLGYRVHRNALFTLLLGAPLYFLVLQRWPFDAPRCWRRERRSVHLTNLAVLALATGLCAWLGWRAVLQVHLPVVLVASGLVVWIFLNQHLFESTYWQRGESWDFVRSALDGSSYYRLPRVLEWWTAHVGMHHVHHLNPGIPNYNLKPCHDEIDSHYAIRPLTLRESRKALRLALWDEEAGRLVGFREVARRRRGRPVGTPERGHVHRLVEVTGSEARHGTEPEGSYAG